MRRIEGSPNPPLIECVNPFRNKWRVRWDVQEQENGNVNYMEEEFTHKPSEEEIRELICSWINDNTDRAILCGFYYDGYMVWLSSENQFNYKVAYDIAIQTDGLSLPVTFKLGTDDEPCYYEFTTLAQITDFYTKAIAHIQKTLEHGWLAKDSINLSLYHP